MNRIIWVLMISTILFSCLQQEEEGNILAQVNQEKLTEIDLKSNFSDLAWKQLSQEEKKDLVQDWIELTLLAQEADQQLISVTPEIQNKIRLAEKNIKSNGHVAFK